MWYIPSKGRPFQLQNLIYSMVRNGSTGPGVVWLNADDPALLDYDHVRFPDNWQKRIAPAGIVGQGEKQRRMFAEFPAEPWYGIIGDDHTVETEGFEERIILSAGRFGIAGTNDGWQANEDVTLSRMGASVFGGDFIRAIGYWAPKGFDHLYIDDVWETLGRALGNWRTLMDVVISHPREPYLDTSKMDATCARVNTPEAYASGKARFEEWLKNEAGTDIERARRVIADTITPPESIRSRSVMIATPCYGDVAPEYAAALVETVELLRDYGILCEVKMIRGLAIHVARNSLANSFLHSQHTDLLFIDADMAWSPWDVIRLLTSQQAMIAGIGHKKRAGDDNDPDVWCFKGLEDAALKDENGNVEVQFVGTGFMLIHRSVLHYISEGRPDLRRIGSDGRPYVRFFAWGDENGAELSEDFEFCRRWRAIGGKVWVDPGIRLKHFGSRSFDGDVLAVLK